MNFFLFLLIWISSNFLYGQMIDKVGLQGSYTKTSLDYFTRGIKLN